MVNTTGELSSIDPTNGSPKWTTRTLGGRLVAVGGKKVYMRSDNGDLFIVNRENGQMIVDPRASLERAGLNIRGFDLGVTNRMNDRIYLGTSSGMLLSVREAGQTIPRPLRDPKAIPFGTVPREGVSLLPPPVVPVAPEAKEPPAPETEKPPAAGDVPPPSENPK